jgi:hypothetical protein
MIVLHLPAQVRYSARVVGQDTPALTFPCRLSIVLLALKIRTRVLQVVVSVDFVFVSI